MDDMGLKSILRPAVAENRARAFCKCSLIYDAYGGIKTTNGTESRSIADCCCGEGVGQAETWTWNSTIAHPETQINGHSVIFHPIYSQGTSMVRGTIPLEKNSIHYWEIKLLTGLSGTDLMLGIGTDKIDLQGYRYKYVSALGLDDQSWGYSYRGFVQHCGRLKYYGKRYIQGCIVGIYLDLFKGHLEFYLNRRPQSIAYRNIPTDPETPIYPMVCSTSAKSSIKLINTASFRECLQFRCMRTISKYPQMVERVKQIPGLRQLCKELWFLQCKEQYQYNEFEKNNLLLEDEAIICDIKNKKYKRTIESSDENSNDSDKSLDDIYDGMYKIKHTINVVSDSSSDDDSIVHILF